METELISFRKEAIEKYADRLYGDITVTPSISQTYMVFILLFVVIIGFVLLANINYTKVETARGWIEFEKPTIRINADADSIVSKVYVQEGASIKKGDVLFKLEQSNNSSDAIESLFNDYFKQSSDLNDALAEQIDKESSARHNAALIKIRETIKKIEIAFGEKSDRIERDIVSPIDGTINNIQIKEGQKAHKNNLIATISPDQTAVFARVLIPINSIVALKTGQQVFIRYDAFPHQKYGLHEGTLLNISKVYVQPNEVLFTPINVTEPVYLASVKLNEGFSKSNPVEILQGMTFYADIATARESFLSRLINRIKK